jgi:NAD(P)-dependent dehydrogenase (short-subunit alcohol dehydrogenase family)
MVGQPRWETVKMKLKDKVALITGASSGIGKAIAALFSQEGAKVALIAGRHIAQAEGVAKNLSSIGGDALALQADISDEVQVRQIVQKVLDRFKQIDILINSAGVIGSVDPLETLESDEWDRVFQIDVRGTFLCSKYCLRTMMEQKTGNIINLSSVAGFKASLISPCYSAAKGAIISLTKSLALRYAKEGIRVNCISPGTIDTPMTQGFFEEEKASAEREKLVRRFVERHPLGRFGKAEEVARGALYLASNDSSFVTGINLIIDGGLSL